MLNAYEAILENGQLTWLDPIPNFEKSKVKVIVLPDNDEPKKQRQLNSINDEANQTYGQYEKSKRIGMLAGKAKFPDDINKYDDEVAQLFGVEL